MKKVSIIVPIYNSENFLEKCINSLISQTYSNIEIIAINDGSKDDSLKILKRLAKKDQRIKIIDKENTGVSDSRNKGLDIASGDLIMFCDSDDWYETDTVEKSVRFISNNDCLRYNERIVYSNGKIINTFSKIKKENPSLIIHGMLNFDIKAHIFNFVYKKSIIDKYSIRFDTKLCYLEDEHFIINYMNKINTIKFIDDNLYNYYENLNSVTNNIDSIIKNFKTYSDIEDKISSLLEDKILITRQLYNLLLLNLEKIIKDKKHVFTSLKKVCISLHDFVIKNYNYGNKKWKILNILIKYKLIVLLYYYIKIYIKKRWHNENQKFNN